MYIHQELCKHTIIYTLHVHNTSVYVFGTVVANTEKNILSL